MAEHGKQPEWKKQEELRAMRRNRKARRTDKKPQPRDTEIRPLVLVCDSPAKAYHALTQSETMRIYFPRLCEKHWQRQAACMARRIEILGPAFIMTRILKELSPAWRMGKLDG